MKITRKSVISGKTTTMNLNITEQQLADWTNNPGLLIHNAFPSLSPDEKDFLLTGITPEEWKAEFGEEEGEGYANTG